MTDDFTEVRIALPVAIAEAAQAMYSTYCGMLGTRGLMPSWHDLDPKIKVNFLRMAEAAKESFERNGMLV